ncbi:unnamed protein product [Acanthoscelides obtectus]|uniref:DDE Tnp4 domain-containing protein n=1 Tax=Acanthoscelides obtectus TaxID=200917 RepID=A0A9P0PSK2_ACAOB|nr:unnamed protein product [Acanthoscelides obtectus]CAK1685873.1 Protein ALP1-like [Acanthoscelides obtectus]
MGEVEVVLGMSRNYTRRSNEEAVHSEAVPSRRSGVPQTENDWIAIAKDFEKRWNFPHCLGSLDGKHIDIIPPANSGSFFFNYKHRHSLVLLAIADANYKFISFDFGTNGRVSDGGVLQNTEFFRRLQAKLLNIPGEKEVANESRKLPFVFVADDAFPLRPDMLKPYRQTGFMDK